MRATRSWEAVNDGGKPVLGGNKFDLVERLRYLVQSYGQSACGYGCAEGVLLWALSKLERVRCGALTWCTLQHARRGER